MTRSQQSINPSSEPNLKCTCEPILAISWGIEGNAEQRDFTDSDDNMEPKAS